MLLAAVIATDVMVRRILSTCRVIAAVEISIPLATAAAVLSSHNVKTSLTITKRKRRLSRAWRICSTVVMEPEYKELSTGRLVGNRRSMLVGGRLGLMMALAGRCHRLVIWVQLLLFVSQTQRVCGTGMGCCVVDDGLSRVIKSFVTIK